MKTFDVKYKIPTLRSRGSLIERETSKGHATDLLTTLRIFPFDYSIFPRKSIRAGIPMSVLAS